MQVRQQGTKDLQNSTYDSDVLARDACNVVDGVCSVLGVDLSVSEKVARYVDPDWIRKRGALGQRNKVANKGQVTCRASAREQNDWRDFSIRKVRGDVDGCS